MNKTKKRLILAATVAACAISGGICNELKLEGLACCFAILSFALILFAPALTE